MNKLKEYILRIPRHLIYPIVVIILFIIATATGASGSSIGMYHQLLGSGEDSAIISGEPRGIRADEWMLITSKTVAQSYNDYAAYNPNVGPDGEDLSLRPDVPTTAINTIFRPQNWAFFVIPLENAIAFKWWFFTAFTLLTAYYFSLRFFSKNIIVAVLLSIFIVFAPLPQWTYREFIFLTLGFGLLGVMVADWLQQISIKNQKNRRKQKKWLQKLKIASGVGLVSYAAIGYMLILYPPMQISIALVLLAYYIDLMRRRQREHGLKFKQILYAQKYLVIGLGVTLLIATGLFLQQKDTITALRNTEHPGVRHFESGWTANSFERLRNLWVGGSVPLILQKDTALAENDYFAKTDTGNQSEASNYLWLLPLLVVMAVLMYRKLHRQYLPWVTIAAALFVMAWMLVPGISLPLVEQVQPARWNLAIGLLSFILLGVLAAAGRDVKGFYKTKNGYITLAVTVAFVATSCLMFVSLNSEFGLLVTKWDALIFGLLAIIPPFALLFGYHKTALALLAGVSFIINANVNPLYQGVDAATKNNLVTTIRQIDQRDSGVWLMAANTETFEHVPLLAGAKSVTTHFSYPQGFWKHFDPDGEQESVYNRAAHIRVALTDGQTRIYLQATNSIGVEINPCDKDIINDLDITYVITIGRYTGTSVKCMKHVTDVKSGGSEFTIYKSQFSNAQ